GIGARACTSRSGHAGAEGADGAEVGLGRVGPRVSGGSTTRGAPQRGHVDPSTEPSQSHRKHVAAFTSGKGPPSGAARTPERRPAPPLPGEAPPPAVRPAAADRPPAPAAGAARTPAGACADGGPRGPPGGSGPGRT